MAVYPASISDSRGGLIFYGGNRYFYNGQHQQLSTILPANLYPQSALISKVPGTKKLLFIFSTANSTLNKGEVYSIEFDPSLNSGQGGIVNGSLSQIPGKFHFLAFTLLDHENGQDKWLLLVDSNHRASSFLISSSGIATTPVVSQDFSVLQRSAQAFSFRIIKSSPNSRFISLGLGVDGDLGVFEFDRSTGMITNILFRDWKPLQGHYYIGFSPSSRLLYVTTKNLLLQYDLTSKSQSLIKNSEFLVDSVAGTVPWHFDLQLAPNGKIYQLTNGSTSYLNSINCPDIYGNGCDYQSQTVHMKRSYTGSFFPTLNQTLYVNTHKLQAQSQGGTVLCQGDSTVLTAYGAATDDFYWSPSNGLSCTNCQSPMAAPDTTTTYRVIGIARSCAQDNVDTAYVTIYVNPPKGKGTIQGDTLVCGANPTTLSGPKGFDNYWWLQGFPGRVRTVYSADTYKLRVSSKCYTDTLTHVVRYEDSLQYTFPNDTSICASDFPITLTAQSNFGVRINLAPQTQVTFTKPNSAFFETSNHCTRASKIVRVDTIVLPQPIPDTSLPDSMAIGEQLNLPITGYALQSGELRSFSPGTSLQYGTVGEAQLFQIRGTGSCTDTVQLKSIVYFEPEVPEVENVPCEMSVSPNPGSESFELIANQELKNIGVYDARGRAVYVSEVPQNTPVAMFSERWSVGTYFVQATCKDETVLRVKWVKR